MARAKNTSRSEARRRSRELARADQMTTTDEDATQSTPEPAAAAPAPRSQIFKLPDFRGDIRALPQVFRSRRLIWLPLLLLVVGLALTLMLPGLPAEVASIVDLYIQFFFVPPALFTFFIAGFFAPRASYLVGLIYGLLAGVMWTLVILGPGTSLPTSDGTAAPPPTDAVVVAFNMMLIGGLYGTLAAAFASWYRDFLRGMQARGAARRAEQEAKERAKRRDERQEARRIAKQRPSS